MNATVAIALITSLSTLTAAGLTGTIAAWSNRNQLRHQREIAHEERAEERAARQRELRRVAYEQFLSLSDEAYRVLDEGWHAAPFTDSPRWDAGFAARRALDEAYVRLQLHGPEEVVERGAAVVRGVGEEFRLHRRVIEAHPDSSRSAAGLDRDARKKALEARFRTTKEFVAAARQALGGQSWMKQ